MAFDFPSNPSQNQEFTPASPTGHTYIFKSPRWVIKAANTSGGIITVDWDDITNLPPDFPPSAHTHPQSEVIDLVADLAVKAPLASPNFIGVPRAPTAAAGTADTQIASTQFVAREIASGAFTDAPSDGTQYARMDAAWSQVIPTDWADITNPPIAFPPDVHTHPQTDVTNLVADLALKAPLADPALTGVPTAPTAAAATATTQLATTAFVQQELATFDAFPEAPVDGSQYARQDAAWSIVIPTDWATIPNKPVDFPATPHTHPQADVTNLVTDLALKAPLASPALTGIPTAPTAVVGTSTTQLATTEFVSSSFAAINVPVFSTDAEMDILTPLTTELVNPQNVRFLVGGQLSTLTTTVKTALIPAINEVDAETTQLTADVAAINTSITTITTDLTQVTADLVALDAEVALLAQGHEFVGTFKGTGEVEWTAASGGTLNVLPVADPTNMGWYLICDGAGAAPPANAPLGDYAPADWLISDGSVWTHLDYSSTSAAVTATNVTVTPAVPAGATNVQASLTALDATKEPTLAPGLITDYYAGDKTWKPMPAGVDVSGKADITYVDAENDAQDAANLLLYEPIIAAGTVATHLWQGNKTWIDPALLPPSTAQAAIDATQTTDIAGKETAIVPGLVTDYWNGLKAWVPFPATEPPLPAGGLATDYLNGLKVWTPFPAAAPATFIGDAPPATPVPGQMWWESDSGSLMIWYDDTTSQQWVAAAPAGAAGPAGPAGAASTVPGPAGPAGPEGIWTEMTQAAYDALPTKDPAVLYIVVG